MTRKRTAVVVIHGMGEQKPMDTLREFVDTVWSSDASLFEGVPPPRDDNYRREDAWRCPDDLSDSAELRHMATRRARNPKDPGKEGPVLEFFELYWADVTANTTWGDFLGWLWRPTIAASPTRSCNTTWTPTAIRCSSTRATAWRPHNFIRP